MFIDESSGLLLGAVALGAVHGIEPGHGWPVAASYALDQSSKWLYGLAASLTIGIGHLISSIAMVAVFFYAKSYFALTQINEPLTVAGSVQIGGPVSLVAGLLLVALGIREYRHGHSHGGGHSHGDAHAHGNDHTHEDDHSHGDAHAHGSDHDHTHSHGDAHTHSHGDDHTHEDAGLLGRVAARIPFLGGGHSHGDDDVADRGLLGIAWFAFVLGFAHEEEFEIIALCAGSTRCLELMGAYALTVIAGIVTLTLLLIGGYQNYEERIERYTPYLPLFSATVLILMGIGFILGVF